MKQTSTIRILALLTLLSPAGALAQSGMHVAWEQRADIPTPRAFATACELGGKIYVMGGAINFFESTPALEMYDPGEDEWDTTLNNMPISLCAAASAVVEGKIYVFGGLPTFGSSIYLNSVYVYDPSDGGWSMFPVPMLTPRAFHAACVIGDSAVYLIGGRNNSAFSLTSVEKFVPKDSSWTTVDNMTTPRSHPTAKVLKGKIYAMAGIIDNSGNGTLASTVEILDPASDGNLWEQWPGATPAGVKRLMHGSGVFQDSVIYLFGGINSIALPLPLFTFYAFEPENGFVLIPEAALPDTMIACASTVSGNYQFGISGVLPPFLPPFNPGPPASERTWALHLIDAVKEAKPVAAPVLLYQNTPNPFSAQTTITYELKKSADINIQVFDLNGLAVATLFEGRQGAGEYSVFWDAAGVPSGVYFYKLSTEDGVLTRKCILQNF